MMNKTWMMIIAAVAALAIIGVAAALVFNGGETDADLDEQTEDEAAAEGGDDGEGAEEEDVRQKGPATLELESAWADPGACRTGEVESSHEQCHRVELFVEAAQDTDFDVTMMSWRGEDDKGETHTPTWVEEPMQVFAGTSRTITLWFDLEDGTQLTSVQHLDTESTIDLHDYWTPSPATVNDGTRPGGPQPTEEEAEPEQDPVY